MNRDNMDVLRFRIAATKESPLDEYKYRIINCGHE